MDGDALRISSADGPGVFRIESYLIRPKRLPKNDCSTHSLAVFRWDSGIFHRAFRDLSEDVRFREFLRARPELAPPGKLPLE